MHLMTAVGELTEAELLDHADEVSRMQRECEAQIVRIAVQHAILNNPETLDPEISKLPGRERARRFGGVGTPEVAEFAAASLGARLGISSGHRSPSSRCSMPASSGSRTSLPVSVTPTTRTPGGSRRSPSSPTPTRPSL